MQEILPRLQNMLLTQESVSLSVLNPDLHDGYAGNKVIIDDFTYVYRGIKAWVDLAELLGCKMLLPKEADYPFVELTFKKLSQKSFHEEVSSSEKYGMDSHFSSINKMEEPAFIYYYLQALSNVKIERKKRILNLGINRGDEFKTIKNILDINKYKNIDFVGIDHCESTMEYANKVFEEKNVKFYAEDINHLDTLDLGRFDLLISIGTLQSPSINFKVFLMSLVQNYLEKDSAIILGFPNSRWIGGEMIYGAKAPNYAMSEMSLLLNDLMFAKKYLQQKRYRVSITGKQYIFLTATRIGL